MSKAGWKDIFYLTRGKKVATIEIRFVNEEEAKQVIVATNSWLSEQNGLFSILDDYKIFISPGGPRLRRCFVVLLMKNLCQEIKTIPTDPEGRLVILDVMFSSGKSFRLVAVYVPFGCLIFSRTCRIF